MAHQTCELGTATQQTTAFATIAIGKKIYTNRKSPAALLLKTVNCKSS